MRLDNDCKSSTCPIGLDGVSLLRFEELKRKLSLNCNKSDLFHSIYSIIIHCWSRLSFANNIDEARPRLSPPMTGRLWLRLGPDALDEPNGQF